MCEIRKLMLKRMSAKKHCHNNDHLLSPESKLDLSLLSLSSSSWLFSRSWATWSDRTVTCGKQINNKAILN